MTSLNAGGMAGAFFATNASHYIPFGMEGWRFAFHVVAVLSICLAFLLRALASDPRKKASVDYQLFNVYSMYTPSSIGVELGTLWWSTRWKAQFHASLVVMVNLADVM